MTDVADRLGLSRVTIYRHFADRDHLAFEVAGRMLQRLADTSMAQREPSAGPLESVRIGLKTLITHFEQDREAHLYRALFDNQRAYDEAHEELDDWYLARVLEAFPAIFGVDSVTDADPQTLTRMVTLVNALLGTLGRFAVLGEKQGQELGFDLPSQLQCLEEIVLGYFDAVIAPQATLREQD